MIHDMPAVLRAASSKMAADLIESSLRMGITIDHAQLNCFVTYYNELIAWNHHINLISKKSVGEIVVRHFVDSLISLPYLNHKDGCLMDLGSGGGFPGLPLSIMLPEMRVFLVDSSRKKTSFLSHMTALLRLSKTEVIRARVEDLLTEARFSGLCDMVISRAAFKLDQLLLFSSYLLRRKGQLIAMKGARFDKELTQAERMASRIGMARTVPDPGMPLFNNNPAKNIVIYNRT
jgi:16S rRNA (guanine527-N7)-methyltransferase